MRFRQRGKLSLHRRKHRGYKMKEYTLIGKDGEFNNSYISNSINNDLSEYMSETETLLDKPHQDMEHINIDHSEDHKELNSKAPQKNLSSRRKRKNIKEENSESDSEFEVPTFTAKNRVSDKKKSLRKRKETMKKQLNDNFSIGSEKHEHSATEEVSDSNVPRDSSYDIPNSNLLVVPKQGFRKYSIDSTIDGSHCGRKQFSKDRMHQSKFRDGKQKDSHSNFNVLMDAFKICQKYDMFNDLKEKCGGNYISKPASGSMDASVLQDKGSLNNTVKYLNLSVLDNLRTAAEIQNYFGQLRTQFKYK